MILLYIRTTKGAAVQRIKFDKAFWDQELLDFYTNSLAPEIVSPMHALGQPMRQLTDTTLS